MERAYASGASASAPTAPASPSVGYPQSGNPSTGTPATKPGPYWYHMITEELRAVITAAGLTPSQTDLSQLLQAMTAMYGGKAPVGSSRNAKMSVPVASASAVFSADALVVEDASGTAYRIRGFSKTVNLSTIGAGGMDTGSAPVSGFVALYAIFNPGSGASALMATNATSAVAAEVYGGANMPAGFTASALVSVWPTTAAGYFANGAQRGRCVSRGGVQVLNSAVNQASYASLNLSAAVPGNALAVSGVIGAGSTSTTGVSVAVSPSGSGIGSKQSGGYVSAGVTSYSSFSMFLDSAQTMYYQSNAQAGTGAYTISITGYEF